MYARIGPVLRLRVGGALETQLLVVSDPPHREVDHEATAETLRLSLDDTRKKIAFPAPEVLAASDRDHATEIAASLSGAGVTVRIIDAQELVGIPWPAPVSWFEFGDGRLIARFQDYEVELPFDSVVSGVYCKPPPGFSAGGPSKAAAPALGLGNNGVGVAEAIQWMANLDLYSDSGGEIQRISIVQDVADFSGLGDKAGPSATESMAATVRECERLFTRMTLDTRLETVRPRHRFIMGADDFDLDMRKLFSFGTLLLRQVLASVSPELGDLTQYELGSRLGYVLSRQGSRDRE